MRVIGGDLWLSSENHGCLWREQSIQRNQESFKDNQKEELPYPARQENLSSRAFLACMMEDHVGESLAWVIAWRMLGPKTYLLARRTTQSFGEDWIKSQTSFLRRQILASLAVLRPAHLDSQGEQFFTIQSHINHNGMILFKIGIFFFFVTKGKF